MNCKPGDLCIVVNAGPAAMHCIGRMIVVTELAGKSDNGDDLWHYTAPAGERLSHATGEPIDEVEDCCLKPIRPGDLEDETPTVRELEAA